MHIKIIFIYCICDDFFSTFGLKDDKQCRMTSAEILTVAIVSALFFNGNFEKIRLIADRKKNATRQYSGSIQYLHSILRKRIETTFSQLTSMFARKIHAVTKKGFLLKLVIFIISFSIEQAFR